MNILNSVKPMVFIDPESTEFDNELIIRINSEFSNLYGKGFDNQCFRLITGNEEWGDYSDDWEKVNLAFQYIYNQIKKKFDPPASSVLMDCLKSTIAEIEFNIQVFIDKQQEVI